MDYDKNKDDTTVQGRDTPVPVRSLSERAGSPGPSACDRSVLPARTQAGSDYKDTGIGCEGIDPFARRESIIRSPPLMGSRYEKEVTKEGSDDVFLLDESEDEGSKRKRSEESPGDVRKKKGKKNKKMILVDSEEWQSCREYVEKVMARIVEVRKYVKVNNNTKIEIKQNSAIALQECKRLEQAWRNVEAKAKEMDHHRSIDDSSREPKAAAGSTRKETRERDPGGPDIEMIERELISLREEVARLRADSADLKKENAALRGTQRSPAEEEVTMDMIGNARTYKEFVELERKIWPKGLTGNVAMVTGNPIKGVRDADLVALCDTASGLPNICNMGMERALKDRYPEFESLEGKIETINITIRMGTGEGRKCTEKWVTKAEIDNEEEDLFNTLQLIRDRAIGGDRKYFDIYPTQTDPKGKRLMRMLICILNGTEIKGEIHIAHKTQDGEVRQPTPKDKKSEDTTALVVREEGKTYADLLRSVKENVRLGSVASKGIRTIREGRNGNMIVVMDKEQKESITELRKQLTSNDKTQVTLGKRANECALTIKGIDALATREEVMEALTVELGAQAEELRLSTMRPLFGGNQAVTVNIEAEKARALLERGKMRIGLSLCSVLERVDAVQCYKCWEYGHRRDRCSNEDRSDLCRKCAGTGHREADCQQSEMKCLSCKRTGHKAGAGSCPEFRKAISRARLLSKKKRGY